MISLDPLPHSTEQYDVILISGDYWADHPHSGIGVIARVLEDANFSVGIIEKPDWKSTEAFLKLGIPRLFFGVSAGAIDSMLVNYTPLKKLRSEDKYYPYQSGIPDRASIVYAQKLREAQKLFFKTHNIDATVPQKPIILGGVEASLRRFTHYDYWANAIRKPLIFDAKADLIVYGSGEHQIVEIAQKCERSDPLFGIEGTCIIADTVPSEFLGHSFEILPSFQEVSTDKIAFCKMQLAFSNEKNLAQQIDNRFLLQFRAYPYTSADLDHIYALPFTYHIPEKFKEFEMAKFSIITHRGCFGNCNFCSIALLQGCRIISRSIQSIIDEVKKMQRMPDFKGIISDLGGPSANMYGMDCELACGNDCMKCPNLNTSHQASIDLLKKIRTLPGIKKVFVRSGIRYDLAMDADEYLEELINHHISGTLKIAPEHFSPKILALMHKETDVFDRFLAKFKKINKNPNQDLRFYLMTAHPGSTMEEAESLAKKMHELQNIENVQIFTPTPMSISTCMYYTGLNPFTLEPIYVPYSYNEKKRQKNILKIGKTASKVRPSPED